MSSRDDRTHKIVRHVENERVTSHVTFDMSSIVAHVCRCPEGPQPSVIRDRAPRYPISDVLEEDSMPASHLPSAVFCAGPESAAVQVAHRRGSAL